MRTALRLAQSHIAFLRPSFALRKYLDHQTLDSIGEADPVSQPNPSRNRIGEMQAPSIESNLARIRTADLYAAKFSNDTTAKTRHRHAANTVPLERGEHQFPRPSASFQRMLAAHLEQVKHLREVQFLRPAFSQHEVHPHAPSRLPPSHWPPSRKQQSTQLVSHSTLAPKLRHTRGIGPPIKKRRSSCIRASLAHVRGCITSSPLRLKCIQLLREL